MKFFIDGDEQGFKRLEGLISEVAPGTRREFYQDVYKEFRLIDSTEIPPQFRQEVAGWQSDSSPFPNFRQKFFLSEFLKTRRKVLNGDTGATKTACSYLAMETLEAKKVTLFGPAQARNTWPAEAKKLFREGRVPDVFTVESEADLNNPRIDTAGYVYVSGELMARAIYNEKQDEDTTPEDLEKIQLLKERAQALRNKLEKRLVEDRKPDGVVIDESHHYNNIDANSTTVITDLVDKMKKRYSTENLFQFPILALTATPISSEISDMDVNMGMVYHEMFALPKFEHDNLITFSQSVLKNPKIAYTRLFGEQLMMQWTLEDMFGEKAPKLEWRTETVGMLAEQAIIYKYIEGLDPKEKDFDALLQMQLLKDVLINPELVRKVCDRRGLTPENIPPVTQLAERLREMRDAWESWLLEKDPAIPDQPFSTEWIDSYGDPDLILQCFFSNDLRDGIETLVNRVPDVKKDWQPRIAKSAKFAYLRRLLEDTFKKDAEGNYTSNKKVFIVSPHHQKGITDALDNPDLKQKDIDEYIGSLFDYARLEWLPDIPYETPSAMISNMDGKKTFDRRTAEAKRWREEGNQAMIEVASMKAVYESMDWAIRDTENNKNIDGAVVIWLGWPWGWDDFKQMEGRFLRPGQAKPVDSIVLEAANTLDVGLYDHVMRKMLLTQLALTGIELTPEQQEFFDSTLSSKRILNIDRYSGQMFLRDMMKKMRANSENFLLSDMMKETDGQNNYDRWAEYYFDGGNDEYRIPGNNAELIKNIAVRAPQHEKVLSIAAGTCLLARKLSKTNISYEIDNVDVNPTVLKLAKEKFDGIGNIYQGLAQDLRVKNLETDMTSQIPSDTYDLVDASLILDLLSLKQPSENGTLRNPTRVAAISEINRVLKLGGTGVLSFPNSAFDIESFTNFANALEQHFGFTLVGPTGKSRAIDLKPAKEIGWVITVRKTGDVKLDGLKVEDLSMLYDSEFTISKRGRGKKAPAPSGGDYSKDDGLFSPHEFEVYNPVTGETTGASSPEVTIKKKEEAKLPITVEEFRQGLRDLSDSQRGIWVDVRRSVERTFNMSYERAETLLYEMLQERDLGNPNEWEENNFAKIGRILSTEIRKRAGPLIISK